MKNSNDTIGNRTRDLPACGAVPQPRTPMIIIIIIIIIIFVNIYNIEQAPNNYCRAFVTKAA